MGTVHLHVGVPTLRCAYRVDLAVYNKPVKPKASLLLAKAERPASPLYTCGDL